MTTLLVISIATSLLAIVRTINQAKHLRVLATNQQLMAKQLPGGNNES